MSAIEVSHPEVLAGEFVNLRRLQAADAGLTLSWRASHRARFLNAGADSIEQQQAWIASRPACEFNFVIELKSCHPIGMLSLIGIDNVNRHAETGRFLIGDEDAAKGLPAAVEAMKLLYEFAFDTLGLVRLHGTVASGNALMVKWQKYLGMKEEGRMRSHYFINGQWQDAVVLGLLAEEARCAAFPRMNALIAAAKRNAA